MKKKIIRFSIITVMVVLIITILAMQNNQVLSLSKYGSMGK